MKNKTLNLLAATVIALGSLTLSFTTPASSAMVLAEEACCEITIKNSDGSTSYKKCCGKTCKTEGTECSADDS